MIFTIVSFTAVAVGFALALFSTADLRRNKASRRVRQQMALHFRINRVLATRVVSNASAFNELSAQVAHPIQIMHLNVVPPKELVPPPLETPTREFFDVHAKV